MEVREPERETNYITSTKGIKISVWPEYDEWNSRIESSLFVYSYVIKIENCGDEGLQLISRSWQIEDASGQVNRVEGEGVVGRKPYIKPGEYYLYKSFCPLRTARGSMSGHFTFSNDFGSRFDAKIESFPLSNNELLN